MKKIIYIYIWLLSTVIIFNACELTQDLDEYKPLYSLDAETAIVDEKSSELALVGVYSTFRVTSIGSPMLFAIPEFFAGFATAHSVYFSSYPEFNGWLSNNPIVSGTLFQEGAYITMYDLINRSNWLIENVNALDENVFNNPNRKNEIIAESKILRAMGNFYLLRLFGQFYDVNSEYGIALRTSPAKDAVALPRNSVSETYAAIIEDLSEGIVNAPALRSKLYTNQTFAKAFKAKVLLYMGQYAEAATLAKELIDNQDANFALEATYDGIFDDKDSPNIYESSEVLFGTGGENNKDPVGMGSYQSHTVIIAPRYYEIATTSSITIDGQTILYDEDRSNKTLKDHLLFTGSYYSSKYTFFRTTGNYEMIYHMRMAEVYLVYAEAAARANSSVTPEVLEALNAIRTRAGATTTGADGFETYPATISYEQFLEAVRMEKLIELNRETGEFWYDMVRYDFLDGFGSGFQVSDIKASATNPDKFILPIPLESIDASNNVVVQNPGY